MSINIYCTPDLSQKKIYTKEKNRDKPFYKLTIDVVLSRRLCAPIASLDCMEEFSGNTGLDLSMGNLTKKLIHRLANYDFGHCTFA